MRCCYNKVSARAHIFPPLSVIYSEEDMRDMDLDRQYDRLLRYCYMKVRDRGLAEDLTQDAFLRFFANRTYRDVGRETAYLYAIARNLCADHFRKHREIPLEELPPDVQAMSDAGKEAGRMLDRLSVEQALDRLEDNEREIVVLRYVAGLKISEIAQSLGLSRFAVRRRLNEALKKLKKEMEGEA